MLNIKDYGIRWKDVLAIKTIGKELVEIKTKRGIYEFKANEKEINWLCKEFIRIDSSL